MNLLRRIINANFLNKKIHFSSCHKSTKSSKENYITLKEAGDSIVYSIVLFIFLDTMYNTYKYCQNKSLSIECKNSPRIP